MKSTRPTLKDVAERSGYALRTVKKVMAKDPTVRDKTREAVLLAAKELHYTRNMAASALARDEQFKIAVVYSRVSEAYFPEIDKGFLRCLKEYKDFGMEMEFATTETVGIEAQLNILQGLLKREDIRGVVIQPYSETGLNDSIDALVDAGKPVVTFGADAPESKRLCYVGPDAYKSGRIGAQILANYIGKHGNVVVLNHLYEHTQTTGRSKGFMARMEEHYPNISVFKMALPDNTNVYYDLVCSIVKNNQADALFCTDANTYIAGQALRDLNRPDIVLIGFDLSEDGADLMRKGYIKAIIEQKPETVSYIAAKDLFRYITECKVPQKITYTPLYIMTSECL